MYATLPLNLISIAVIIRQDIPYSNLLMVGTKVSQKFNQREVTPKVKRERSIFFMRHAVLTLYTLL